MSIRSCLVGTPFYISGDLSYSNNQANFQVAFVNGSDQAAVKAVQWYLNGELVPGQTHKDIIAQVPCGSHTIGARVLTGNAWSGMQYQSFSTCVVKQWFNAEKSQAFFRNNCIQGITGSSVLYTVQANTYTSSISQEDANNLALADIATNGQNYANIHGDCTRIIELGTFDYLAVRYQWENKVVGNDLDILVAYENNGTVYDNLYVGYGNNVTVPRNVNPSSDAYLWWGINGQGTSGYEGVLINIRNFLNEVPNLPNTDIIEVGLYQIWNGAVSNGGFTLSLLSYRGGSITVQESNFVNMGGAWGFGQNINRYSLIRKTGTISLPTSYYKVGTVRYNKKTDKGTIEISYN